MTLLGKVFTGLVAVLSLIFFSLSVAVNATHISQKEIAAAAQKQATEAQTKNTQLSELLERTRSELAIEQLARRSALSALQTALIAKTSALEAKEAELVQRTAENTQLAQTANTTQQELKARSDENELLRQQIIAERQNVNQILESYVATKDQHSRLQGMYETLVAQEKQLSENYTAAREILDVLNIKENTLLDAPPPVNGEVLAVDTSGLIEVSLGRDDGMREGFTLEVSRNGQYLGRVKVRTVRDDKSVAEVLTGYQRGYIRQGDRVDSKLF